MSFIRYDRVVPNSPENCVMLPEIVVTYDTVKCKCEVTIKHRSEMNRRGMEFQRGRMNPMMGRGQMNRGQFRGDTTKTERPPMMGFGPRGRMMNPRMEQMMREHKQFRGDTTKTERPMRLNHRQ
jgi:hypothetical protein